MDKFDIPNFKFKLLPPGEVRDEWLRYKRHFEYLALANGVTNKTRLKHIFLARAGPDVQEVFSSIPGADVEERMGVDPFKVAIGKLDEYFSPKQHEAYKRFQFWSLKTQEKEPLDKFLLRAMELANKCNFGSNKQEAQEICVVDKVILMSPPDLREKLLQREKLTLDDVSKMVNSHESIRYQATQMSTSGDTQRAGPSEINRIQNPMKKVECIRCGRTGHYGSDTNCPARNKACDKCGKLGHFARCCRSQQQRQGQTRHSTKRRTDDAEKYPEHSNKRPRYQQVRSIKNEEQGNDSNFIFSIGEGDEFLWVTIGGVLLQVLIDSGCQKNVIDDVSWDKMKSQAIEVTNRRAHSDQSFRAYGRSSKPLIVKEVFEAKIEVQDHEKRISCDATFYVIEGGTQPLLGRTTAKDLGVLTLGLPSTNPPEVYTLRAEQKHPFPKMKGIKLKIPIDEKVTPVTQHARRPPLALLDKIKDKLDSLLNADIIEPVEEYSQWVSPLVAIVKDNGDLRLCVDMRRANLAIKREGHLMPTFEDFLPRLKKARLFTRLDIKEAFHQVELHESCRHITTFISHAGVFRYKRLMFGVSCAPEMFQKVLEQILSKCKNIVVYIDDILVFGEDEEDHDRALEQVMEALNSKGVLLNHQKCEFKTREVVFLG